ncbi:MAG: hypothetical protein Q9224_003098 [Gallowayella concinna]
MGSQFSLSLELTKLVPFGSLFNAAGHGLVRLVRDIQASGSDFITEEDLAQVFGRNRIEPLFASTFRTAVKHSVIHQLTGIAELVIEGGAGPTVKRSLNEPGYFAMVVQLSLLTYTHELIGLTKALIKGFERRAHGASEYVAPPRYDALKGTLRAIREQTCGFMWELFISAVERKLFTTVGSTDGGLYHARVIPQVIIQALLDSFTAIQHMPEHTYLRICTSTGMSTIVVWAHRVLGLSVRVDTKDQEYTFGQQPVSIYIDANSPGRTPEVALLNETNDSFFQLSTAPEDTSLMPISHHPIRDYGTISLRLMDDSPHRARSLVESIVTSCIVIARDCNEARYLGGRESEGRNHSTTRRSSFPTVQQVLSVSRLLFWSDVDVIDAINLDSDLPCQARKSESELPRLIFGGFQELLRLTHVVLVISMARGFEEDLMLHIDSLEKTQYMPFNVPDARSAFVSLVSLLQGRTPQREENATSRTSVVSAWGWSLCLGSLACQDPSDIGADLVFFRGVPTRGGEKRRYIIDGVQPRRGLAARQREITLGDFALVSGPGEKCMLSSWAYSKKTRHFVGVTDDAFEVLQVLSCEPVAEGNHNQNHQPYSLTIGFRTMQEASWNVIHIPACEHSSTIGQSTILPDCVWTFHGFESPFNASFAAGTVLAGLVAGASSARWILIDTMLRNWNSYLWPSRTICVRSRDCCFECSLQFAKSNRQGSSVGLVL